jgi:DNA-binding SARP family transcriptional activator
MPLESRSALSFQAPDDTLSLVLFGGVDLRGPPPADPAQVLTQPKLIALLAYLAVQGADRFVRRDRVVALLWAELDQNHARGALRRAVYTLRAALGDVVATRGDEDLALDHGAVWCDVSAFDCALRDGYLAAALALYRDEILPGFHLAGASDFSHWLDGERAIRRQRAADAAWALAQRYESANDLTAAGGWARRAALLAGDDERAIRRALVLLDRLGDRAGAMRLYEDFAQRLRDELSMDPSPETQATVARWRTTG